MTSEEGTFDNQFALQQNKRRRLNTDDLESDD